MGPTVRPRLKVCCIMSHEEARMAIAAGADAIGLVAAMPSGPGPMPDEMIAAIARAVPPPIATFLLTSERSAVAIASHHERVRTSTVQIVDRLSSGTHADLRERLPGIKIVQVIHVVGPTSLDEAIRASGDVDALLLDSGRPAMAVKELGGTGRRHDWTISRKIREAVGVPVFLAGGLHAGNAREAIELVGPFGLDVCSGVRTSGKLDPLKLAAFVSAARA